VASAATVCSLSNTTVCYGDLQTFAVESGDDQPFADVAVGSGYFTTPALVDLDDDGDLDLLVGAYNGNMEIQQYENVGSAASPTFTLVNTSIRWTSDSYQWTGAPCPVDVDGDGDFDIVVGIPGELLYFQNNGSATSPSFSETDSSNPFRSTNATLSQDDNPKPTFFDSEWPSLPRLSNQ